MQRQLPKDSEELWDRVEELWSYRSEKPLFWEDLVKSFKYQLQEIAIEEGSKPSP